MRITHQLSERQADAPVAVRIRVALEADQPASQVHLRSLIARQPDITLVPDTPDAPADVAVIDAVAPTTALIATIERIRRRCPSIRLLILTTHDAPGRVDAILAAGATGYVVKPATDQEVLTALRAVHRGRTFIELGPPDGLTAVLSRDPATPAPPHGAGTPRLLSPREREVLDLLVRGYANHEIAEQLRVSVKTVETHRARMAYKLGVRTRAELVEYALLEGRLALPPRAISDSA